MLPYNDILNRGHIFVKFEGIQRYKSIIEYLYRCWVNVYGISISGWFRESPINKNDGNKHRLKWCQYIDRICSAMVDWLLLNCEKCGILSTIMMCLAMGYWMFFQKLQKCEYFCILLKTVIYD